MNVFKIHRKAEIETEKRARDAGLILSEDLRRAVSDCLFRELMDAHFVHYNKAQRMRFSMELHL